MIYVPLRHIRPGMIIGRSISAGSSVIPLVVSGQRVTTETLAKLQERRVEGIYIQSKFFNDIATENYISTEFKQELTSELQGIYTSYLKKAPISPAMGKSMLRMADSLMTFVLSKEECLLNVVEIKDYDNYTYSHSVYVGVLAVLIGMQLGLSKTKLSELAMTGLLHDIGKLDVPVSIVNKPAALTDTEFEEMKHHPTYAVERLRAVHGVPSSVILGIENHHEKYNGTGYPHGIRGNSIPLYGRILALADVYDALTSSRSYRRAWLPHEAIEYMMGSANSHFDFDILKAFLKTVAAYPLGTIVELSNGAIGVVTHVVPEHILRPIVRIVTNDNPAGFEVDLSSDRRYLNVTIIGTISDSAGLPDKLFK